MRFRIATLLACATLASKIAAAQTVADIPAESRVRLTFAPLPNEVFPVVPRPLVASFVRASGDSLWVVGQPNTEPARYVVSGLARIDYSTGRHHPRWRATLIGFVSGAAMGYVYGRSRASAPERLCTDASCPTVSPAERRRGGGQVALIGAGVGLIGGYTVGSLVWREQWTQVSMVPAAPH